MGRGLTEFCTAPGSGFLILECWSGLRLRWTIFLDNVWEVVIMATTSVDSSSTPSLIEYVRLGFDFSVDKQCGVLFTPPGVSGSKWVRAGGLGRIQAATALWKSTFYQTITTACGPSQANLRLGRRQP